VPFARRSCGQHDDAARAHVPLLSPKPFLGVEGTSEVNNEHVAWDGGQLEVILGVMDFRRIDAAPTPTAAREQDVLRWHVRSLAGKSSFG
jgi:hypothetical protein